MEANKYASAIRWSTPKIRTPRYSSVTQGMNSNPESVHRKNGVQLRNNPIMKIRKLRQRTFLQNVAEPCAIVRGITKAMALPTANRKNGYTRSVGVRPCQAACSRGAKICDQLPGLLTRIIRQTAAPLNTSKERYLFLTCMERFFRKIFMRILAIPFYWGLLNTKKS